MTKIEGDAQAVWTSAKGRERIVRVVTHMECSEHHIVRVLRGLPGEGGSCWTVPTKRLHVLLEG